MYNDVWNFGSKLEIRPNRDVYNIYQQEFTLTNIRLKKSNATDLKEISMI